MPKTQIPREKPAWKPSKTGNILLIMPATAFGLGVWQIYRWRRKLGIIQNLETKMQIAPVSLPDNLDVLKDMEYRQVTVTGQYDFSNEVCIGPRSNIQNTIPGGGGGMMSRPSAGVYIVTPFRMADRDLTILVNRGWLSSHEVKDPEYRRNGQVPGLVQLTGVVRTTERRQPMMPKEEIADRKLQGLFLYRNIEKISEHLGTAPVFLDANSASTVKGGPIAGQTKVQVRNDHLTYIAVWFSLGGYVLHRWYRTYRAPIVKLASVARKRAV